METWQTGLLPVVEKTTGKLIGQILSEQLSDSADANATVSSLDLDTPVAVYPHHHIFEAARLMLAHEIRLLPVVDSEQTFIGVVEKKRILEIFSEMFNISEQGSVISVEVSPSDYSLSHLVHLIESESARILGVAVEAPKGRNENFLVSFKLSVKDSSIVSQTLRRHGYQIRSETHSELIQFDMSDRAKELIRYLDV